MYWGYQRSAREGRTMYFLRGQNNNKNHYQKTNQQNAEEGNIPNLRRSAVKNAFSTRTGIKYNEKQTKKKHQNWKW
jgi:hypothetical protein